MTVLADFEVIQSEPVEIGDSPAENPWVRSFNSGGRLVGFGNRKFMALVMLMVQNLNRLKDADVEINGQVIGKIFSTVGPDFNWVTQTISFPSSVLSNGDNRISIRPVPSDNPKPGDIFENFKIMSVVCFFRQDSH